VFALRFYDIRFPDGRIIASASSSWLIIDRTTKKIQRPDSSLTSYNSVAQTGSVPVRNALKLSEYNEYGQISSEFKVKLSDLDVNLHTNNVNYLKWVIDSYDIDFTMNHVPSSVEINYLAESMFGENIMIRTSKEEGNSFSFRHSIIRPDDKKELCRIKLEWKERDNN
jgi:medium-chain acyl-[acyl-carrier-protein] hydrolase